jgi:hypothetical protein
MKGIKGIRKSFLTGIRGIIRIFPSSLSLFLFIPSIPFIPVIFSLPFFLDNIE